MKKGNLTKSKQCTCKRLSPAGEQQIVKKKEKNEGGTAPCAPPRKKETELITNADNRNCHKQQKTVGRYEL